MNVLHFGLVPPSQSRIHGSELIFILLCTPRPMAIGPFFRLRAYLCHSVSNRRPQTLGSVRCVCVSLSVELFFYHAESGVLHKAGFDSTDQIQSICNEMEGVL